MSRFLITGARSPVALELMRNLVRHGHQVVVADSLRYPLAKHSRYASKYVRFSSPVSDLNQFKENLIAHIKAEKIDYLLPTCEEIFYIAFFKNQLSEHCKVLCDSFEVLSRLHSKYTIMEMAKGCGIEIPETERVEVKHLKLYSGGLSGKVLKAEYSRFGVGAILTISKKNVNKFICQARSPIVLQQKIQGTEYCTYSIAVNGSLVCHSCYQPLYRSAGSAGIYFKPAIHDKIRFFVESFVKKHQYTGQIGFDIIDNGTAIYLIECNPRATSGLHLVLNEDLAACLLGQMPALIDGACPFDSQPAMIGLAMKLTGLPLACVSFKLWQWYHDYSAAKDVLAADESRSFMLYCLLSLAELIKKSISTGRSLQSVSTVDIEWNGQKL